jgi:hypothetical protein
VLSNKHSPICLLVSFGALGIVVGGKGTMEYADDDICLRPSSLAVREPTRSVPGLGESTATISSNSLRPDDTNDEVDKTMTTSKLSSPANRHVQATKTMPLCRNRRQIHFLRPLSSRCSACNPLSFRMICATVLTTSAKRQLSRIFVRLRK